MPFVDDVVAAAAADDDDDDLGSSLLVKAEGKRGNATVSVADDCLSIIHAPLFQGIISSYAL